MSKKPKPTGSRKIVVLEGLKERSIVTGQIVVVVLAEL